MGADLGGYCMRAFAVLASAFALACGAAAAPPKKAAQPLEPPMQFHVVRGSHAECEPQCLQWIAAQGRIVVGSANQLKKVLRQLGDHKLPVFIDSGGGAVNDALAMGRLIRAKGLDIAVTKTAFTPCTPADGACRKAKSDGELRGLAQAHLSKCASSCAFVLAGGVRRLVGPGTSVGVHQISMTLLRYQVWTRRSFGVPVETKKTLLSRQTVGQKHAETESTYSSITTYLREMGISNILMGMIRSTPNDTISWLTASDLHLTGLATDFINGEQLVTGVAPSAATAVPQTPQMPPQAATTDVMDHQHICAKFGVCDQGSAQNEPKNEPKYVSPGSLLSPAAPPTAPTPPKATPPSAETTEAERNVSGAQ
jgi:hypothetical protein